MVIAVCLFLNALFAAYEMAFVSVPKPELRRLAKAGVKEAQILLPRRDNPERTLSVIQIGITLVAAVAAAVGGAGAAESIEPLIIQKLGVAELTAEILAVALVVIPLTYFSVVAGELVPKSLALRHPVKIALVGARWLAMAERVLSPLVNVLERSTKIALHAFFRRSKPADTAPQTTVEIDTLSPAHQQFVINLAYIERKQVKDILVPWNQVNFVRSTDKIEDVTSVVFTSGHTRLPVVDDGNVIGILHTKEFLAYRESGEKNWRSIVRPVLKVQATDSVLRTLRLMQERRSHMAVVYSAAGERLGIVTLEDIIEEIIGDVFDEDDDGRVRKVFAARAKSRLIPPGQG